MRRIIRKKRALTMIFSAVAIFFTGYPHVWAIYAPHVMETTGWTAEQTSMCFYLALLSFVFGNIIGGRIQDRSRPILVLSLGGIIEAAGIILSAFLLIDSPLPIYLTYGIMHGFGQGMVYTVILSTAQKWFPQRKGFATGVVVTANGLCGFFLAPLSRSIIEKSGPAAALLTVGVLMMTAWLLSVLFVRVPEPAEVAGVDTCKTERAGAVRQFSSGEMIRTRSFYLLAAAMMCGLLSYFLVSPITQTLQIERGVSRDAAVAAVMIGSIMNAAARLFLPALADRIGRVPCIKIIMAAAAAAMTLLAVSTSYLTTIGVIVMYWCFGGIMGSFPAFTSSIFGMRHSGENYGYVMSGVVAATLGAPLLSGIIIGFGLSQRILFVAGAGFALLAFLLIVLLNRELQHKTIQKEEREVTTCL